MPTALITGASAGIGEVFARRLASRKYQLILVARRGERLQAIAEALSESYGVRCEVVVQDLGVAGAAARVLEAVAGLDLSVDLLVNNAGFGLSGDFSRQDPERLDQLIAVNVTALTDLTRGVLPAMLARRSGAILNVASTAAFQAIPTFAAYAAAKAYVLHFSEALAAEVRGAGVVVTCLCPGVTRTEFADVAQIDLAGAERFTQTPEDVVDEALEGLARGRSVVVSGRHNQVAAALSRLVPRRVATWAAARAMGGRSLARAPFSS